MYCSVAVVSASGCIAEHSLISKTTHSKRLLDTIATLMQECELDWSDLHGLAISLGPGSFTGLRIGLTTIKGLSMATGLPLMGHSTLEALACQFPHCHLPICPILDARKQELYAGLYQTQSGHLVCDTPPVVIPAPELCATIHTPTLFIGDGVEVCRELLCESLGDKAIFAPPQLAFPRAASVGHLALRQFTQSDFLDPATAAPLYIRPSDAEVNLRKAQNNQST